MFFFGLGVVQWPAVSRWARWITACSDVCIPNKCMVFKDLALASNIFQVTLKPIMMGFCVKY
jgi:hypothetical protein